MKLDLNGPDTIGEELSRITREACIPLLLKQVYSEFPVKYAPMTWRERLVWNIRIRILRVRDAWRVLIGDETVGGDW